MEDSSTRLEQASVPKRTNLLVRLVVLARNIAILGISASWFAHQHWIADLVSHLRVQFAILLVPAITLAMIRRKRIVAMLVFGLFLYSVWPMIPYFIPRSPSAVPDLSGTTKFRLLSFNVLVWWH